MNLTEATKILKSVGYNVTADLDKRIERRLNTILESMENRGAVHTDAYAILAEMAIKKPRNVSDENPWNDSDERFSKLQATIQSKMTRGGEVKASTLAKWVQELDAIEDNLSNPAVLRELPNLKSYLSGDTDLYTSSNQNNTGELTGDFKTDRKNISSSISTLGSHGGKNYQALLARIDELERTHAPEVNSAEAAAIEKLRTDLETAQQKALELNNASGKTATFQPAATATGLRRATRRLDQNNIDYTVNDDGTISITSKVKKAKTALEGLGEFIVPTAPTRAQEPEGPTELVVNADAETADLIGDIVTDNGATMVQEDGVVTITGTAAQIAAVKTELEQELPELFNTGDPAEGPVEEPVEDVEEVEDDSAYYEAPEDVEEEIEEDIDDAEEV